MRHGIMVPRDGDPSAVVVPVLMWGLMPSYVLLDDQGQYHLIDAPDRNEPWPYQL